MPIDKPRRKRMPFGYNPRIASRHARFRKLAPLNKPEMRTIAVGAYDATSHRIRQADVSPSEQDDGQSDETTGRTSSRSCTR